MTPAKWSKSDKAMFNRDTLEGAGWYANAGNGAARVYIDQLKHADDTQRMPRELAKCLRAAADEIDAMEAK
jgi:hypothetical protein